MRPYPGSWLHCDLLNGPERVQPLARRPGKRRPGRRGGTGSVENRTFQTLARNLLRAAKACGGRLTLDQTRRTGTLIQVMAVPTRGLRAEGAASQDDAKNQDTGG